jgi:hypothetical protein
VRGRAGSPLALVGDMVRDDREGLREVTAGDLVREGDRAEGGTGCEELANFADADADKAVREEVAWEQGMPQQSTTVSQNNSIHQDATGVCPYPTPCYGQGRHG